MASSHAGEGCEARYRPRAAVGKGIRESGAHAAVQGCEEAMPRRADGTKSADSEDHQAHARREGAVLVTGGAGGNSQVAREAGAVGVVGANVGDAAGVQGLHINEGEGPWPVKAAEDDVWAVAEGGALDGHKLIKGSATGGALGEDRRT